MKAHQKLIPEDRLPDAEARWTQSEAARARLLAGGMRAVGFDHFARPGDSLATGRRYRNFQGYTADAAPVAAGVRSLGHRLAAAGFMCRTCRESPIIRRPVEAGNLATYRGIALTDEDRARRTVIERLMCDLAVDLDAAAPGHEFAAERAALAQLAADGIVSMDGARVTVTEAGRPLVRVVAAAFDTYLQKGRARHSSAV